MAFVIVRHLAPHHESLLNSLLSKETPLQVNDIRDGIPVEINQVYIAPPGKDVIIQNRTLYLQEAKKKVCTFPSTPFSGPWPKTRRKKASA